MEATTNTPTKRRQVYVISSDEEPEEKLQRQGTRRVSFHLPPAPISAGQDVVVSSQEEPEDKPLEPSPASAATQPIIIEEMAPWLPEKHWLRRICFADFACLASNLRMIEDWPTFRQVKEDCQTCLVCAKEVDLLAPPFFVITDVWESDDHGQPDLLDSYIMKPWICPEDVHGNKICLLKFIQCAREKFEHGFADYYYSQYKRRTAGTGLVKSYFTKDWVHYRLGLNVDEVFTAAKFAYASSSDRLTGHKRALESEPAPLDRDTRQRLTEETQRALEQMISEEYQPDFGMNSD